MTDISDDMRELIDTRFSHIEALLRELKESFHDKTSALETKVAVNATEIIELKTQVREAKAQVNLLVKIGSIAVASSGIIGGVLSWILRGA